MADDGFVRDVVRRLRFRVGGERSGLIRSKNEDIAIADAGMKFEATAGDGTAERGADGFDERPAFLAGDVAGREVAHLPVFDAYQIATDGPVVRAEGNAHRSGFKRRPAGVDDEGIVTEETERGHVTGRRQWMRHVIGSANDAGLGDAVHVVFVCSL